MAIQKAKDKKDFFTIVMITQSIVCAVLIVFMLFSFKNGGKFAEIMKNGYLKFMITDFTAENFSDAFRTVKDYAVVFAEKSEQSVVSVFSEMRDDEITEELPTGGKDLEFSSLETLEGISFEKIDIGVEMIEPLKDYVITSPFGYRVSPVSGETGVHTGLDMAADYGEPVLAAAEGIVVDSAWDNSYGNYIKILHSDNTVSIYAHCSYLCADEGDRVDMGEKIAEVGSTGASTGNHLHFEIRKDNIRINPEYVLFGV